MQWHRESSTPLFRRRLGRVTTIVTPQATETFSVVGCQTKEEGTVRPAIYVLRHRVSVQRNTSCQRAVTGFAARVMPQKNRRDTLSLGEFKCPSTASLSHFTWNLNDILTNKKGAVLMSPLFSRLRVFSSVFPILRPVFQAATSTSKHGALLTCLALGIALSTLGCSTEPLPSDATGDGTAARPFPEPARIWRAVSLDSMTVQLTFSEPVSDEGGLVSFYHVTPSLPITAATLSEDRIDVRLTTAQQEDVEYTLHVGDLLAADGDMLDPESRNAVFFGLATLDAQSPAVLSALATDPTTINVAFSEQVDANAENVTSYRIVTDDVTASPLPCSAAELMRSGTEVKLTTTTQRGLRYKLTVNNVSDLSGNEIDGSLNSALFEGIPETIAAELVPPRVLGAVSTRNTTVLVSFSRMMGVSAVQPEYYTIGQVNVVPEAGRLIVTDARFIGADQTAVELTTLSQSEVEYELVVVSVKDLDGNPLDADNQRAFSFLGIGTSVAVGVVDSDGDGVTDDVEQRGWTVTIVRTDGSEIHRDVSSDPFVSDTDGDGLRDQEELHRAADPRNTDTDVDLLTDYEEVSIYQTSPTHQDTDADGLGDSRELTVYQTSPIRTDTDGDDFSDRDEVVTMNRNPRIANLPRPRIDVGDMTLRLDTRFTFTDALGVQRSTQQSNSTSLEESTTQVLAFSDSTTNKAVAEVGTEVTAGLEIGGEQEAGGKPKISGKFSTSAKVSSGFSYMNENTTSVSRQTSQSAKRAYQESLTTSDTVDETKSITREVVGASIDALVTIGNVEDIAFTMTNLEVTALLQNPRDRGSFLPVATLIPAVVLNTGEVPSYTSGPGIPERGPFVFSSREVFPSMVEDLMKNPRGLVFKVANFDVTDELGRNLAFTMQAVNERTAGVTIDYGNGTVDRWRVAVSGALTDSGEYLGGFDNQGRQTGLPLGHVLQQILELEKNGAYDAVVVGQDGCAQTWASGDDVQVVQPVCPFVTPGAVIILSGPNERIESIPRGDDLRLGDAVIDGGDGCAHSVAVGDDEQVVSGACEPGDQDGVVVLPGPNGVIDSVPPVDADDNPLDEIANVSGYATEYFEQCDGDTHPAIVERIVLTADTVASGDDEQLVPFGGSVTPGVAIIGPGTDGILGTVPNGNDIVSLVTDTEIVEPPRTADSVAEGDDVQEVEAGAVVEAGDLIVSAGPDGVLQTQANGNDVDVAPGDSCANGCAKGACRAIEMVVRVKGVRDDPMTSRFWVLMTDADFNSGMDFDAIVLNTGELLTLAYVQDKDSDRMFAREEYIYGSSDRRVNTDGCPDPDDEYGSWCNHPSCNDFDTDCLTDFEEAKIGWQIEVEGHSSYLGFSDPVLPDADADGILDDMERVYGTDPGKTDSDDDGISDGDEINGFAILTKDRQKVIRYVDPYETAVVVDGGNRTVDTPLAGDDLWVEAGTCDDNATLEGEPCHGHADCRDDEYTDGLCAEPVLPPDTTIIITPGPNGVLESIPAGDDGRELSKLIIDGGNGEAESTPAGDDTYHVAAENLLITIVFESFNPGAADCDADDVLVGACDENSDNQGEICLADATCSGTGGGICIGACDLSSTTPGNTCLTDADCDDQIGTCDIGGTGLCESDSVNVGDACTSHDDCFGLSGGCAFPGICDFQSQNAGASCGNNSDCVATAAACSLPSDICEGGVNHGFTCAADTDCPGGECVTPVTQYPGEFDFILKVTKNPPAAIVLEETEKSVPIDSDEKRLMERSVSFALAPHESFAVFGSIAEVDENDPLFEQNLPGNEQPAPATWTFLDIYQAGALTVDQRIEVMATGPTSPCACCYDDDVFAYTVKVEGTVRPGGLVIMPGPNGKLESTPNGDDLIASSHHALFATNPLSRDTDADSLPDGLERKLGANPNDFFDVGRFRDSDRDGLTDGQENDGWFVGYREPSGTTYCQDNRGGFLVVTDPSNLSDNCVMVTSDPLEPDTDGDGLPDALEMILRTNPRDRDTDGDTLFDYDELDPESPDSIHFADYRDFQDLCETGERCLYDPGDSQRYGTNLARVDTDADGLADAVELFDGWIVAPCDKVPYFVQSNPTSSDADLDGWGDGRERSVGSDPNDADSDDDQLIDPVDDFPVSCGKRIILTLVDWSVGSNDCWFDFISQRDGKFDYGLEVARSGQVLRRWNGNDVVLGSGESVVFLSTISFALVPGQRITVQGFIQDLKRTIANNDPMERWDVSQVFEYSSILAGEKLILGPAGGCFSDDTITLQIEVIGG